MRLAVSELHSVQLAISEGLDDWRPDEPRRSSGTPDPTARRAIRNVDVLGPRLEALRELEEELLEEIGRGLAVIEGVRRGLGEKYADVLEQRYIDLRPWSGIEVEGEDIKASTARTWAEIACDWVDSVGVAALLGGCAEGISV